jgi:hypothetical protein
MSKCQACFFSFKFCKLVLFLLFFSPQISFSQINDCELSSSPIFETKASAGIFANLWRTEKSLSYQSERAITALFSTQQALALRQLAPTSCSAGCADTAITMFAELEIVPALLLTDYPDREHCSAKDLHSRIVPIRFSGVVANDEELSDWMENLSRGRGAEGQALYRECDRTCSPQYHFRISKDVDTNGYAVDANVICSHARDKDDNFFRLRAQLRLGCRAET